MFWLVISVLFVVLYYFKLYKPHQYWKDKNVPYIKPLPIFGTTGSMLLRLKEGPTIMCEQYNTYNTRYFGAYMFLKPTLLIKDIDLIKQIFIKSFDHFIDRNVFLNENGDAVFGRSLFFLKGQRWRNMRSTLSPAFTSSKMKSMFALITERAENLANHFANKTNTTEIQTVEMKDVTTRYANDVIASCAFGIKCDSLGEPNNEFYVFGKRISAFGGAMIFKMLGYYLIPKIMEYFKIGIFSEKDNNYYRNLVIGMMENRRKEGVIRPDMIHLLMEAKKGKLKYEELLKNSDAGFATVEESQLGKENLGKQYELTNDDLTGQAVLFLLAGFETSSTVMSFMAYELALNEDVQKKLQDEIDVTMEENNGKLTYEIILKMNYLDMVVSETLRKWPPVIALDRHCTKPYTIEPTEENETPLEIEKGMFVFIPVYAIQRDPKYFPKPDKFDPERFSEENRMNIVQCSYLPFGIGPRNCIGSRFALLEVKAVFVYLLAKFSIVVVKETQIPLRLNRKSFNMNAEKGFWLGLKLRKK